MMIAPRSFLRLLFQSVYRKVHMILCHDLIFHLRLSEVHINFVEKHFPVFLDLLAAIQRLCRW